MIKIEILSKELIFGDFRSSDYGLIIGSFTYNGGSEDDIGMNISTIEEFIGHDPVPIYLGQKYTDKLKLQITLIKDPCIFSNDLYFCEKDRRAILRTLTGIKGYQWLKLIPSVIDDDLWYKARINNITYKRIGSHITGIIFNVECDSCFAWSKEYNIMISAKADQHFFIYNNTDDLNNYVYPVVSVTSSAAGDLSISNINDNNWTSEFKNIKAKEKITIDSKRQIISSSIDHKLLLDNFNLCWFRLIPNKNEYTTNMDITISMKYRVPRKVGSLNENE